MNEKSSTSRPPTDDEDVGRWHTALGDAGPYLGLGLQIAFTMAFYVGAGLGLDFWLGTLPWLTILGALAGLATVLYQVVRVAEELGRRGEQKSAGQSNDEERPKEA